MRAEARPEPAGGRGGSLTPVLVVEDRGVHLRAFIRGAGTRRPSPLAQKPD